MKRAHLISVVIAMLFILPFAVVSCSNSETGMLTSTAVSSVEKVTPTTTPTQTPTPTPTITPTPTPTPTQVRSAEDDLAMAPEISGLAKEVQDGKVVYLAAAGNEYGIEVGKFAGEYNPNVSVEGTKVGAVAFIPVVAEKILNDELAKTPEGEQEFKVLLPVDITQVGENEIILKGLNQETNYGQVEVTCKSDLDISNIIPDSDAFTVYWTNFGGDLGMYANLICVGDNYRKDNKRDSSALYGLQLMVPETSSLDSSTTVLNIKFASNVGSTDGKDVYIGVGNAEGPYPVKLSDLVTINGSLVGITSEK